jgi:hypothetical protein
LGPHFSASQPDKTTFGGMVELAAKECMYLERIPFVFLAVCNFHARQCPNCLGTFCTEQLLTHLT